MALPICKEEAPTSKQSVSGGSSLQVARINKRKVNKYYNINDNTKHFVTAIYDMKNKHPENVDSLDKVRKNGLWSQEWVNNNLIKKELV